MDYRRKHDRHRPRSWISLFLRFGGWLCLIFGVLLIVMTFISATQLYLADTLDSQGRFARAVVLDKRVEVDGDDRTFVLAVRYKTASGGREADARVEQAEYEMRAVGDELVIRYLRSNPGIIEHEIGGYRALGNVFRWIGLAMGLGGLGALWVFGSFANRAIKARRDGEKRFAEVAGIDETRVKINGRLQGRLLWREADGQTGRSLMRDLDELNGKYAHGSKIVVFRLGRHAYWEGDVGPPKRESGG